MIRELVGAIGVGDIDLNDYQIRPIIELQILDMFVLQRNVEIGIEIGGEGGEAERRKERVLDWTPVRTGRLS